MHTIDLHMHSRMSDDGSYSPAELAAMCAAQGIREMALADHNTVRGVAEAVAAADRLGIRCIPAIEVDCVFRDVNLHMLGYGIDIRDDTFRRIEENVRMQAADASAKMLSAVNALGLPVTAAELQCAAAALSDPACWTGELFAEVLLAKPALAEHPLLMPYRAGGARAENPLVAFYWDWFAQGKPCHVPMRYPEAAEVIGIIRTSGGRAVLAHPGMNISNAPESIDALAALGLSGIEAQSSYHAPAQARFYADKAASLGLMTTCGSDFHGKTKPAIHLGDYPDL